MPSTERDAPPIYLKPIGVARGERRSSTSNQHAWTGPTVKSTTLWRTHVSQSQRTREKEVSPRNTISKFSRNHRRGMTTLRPRELRERRPLRGRDRVHQTWGPRSRAPNLVPEIACTKLAPSLRSLRMRRLFSIDRVPAPARRKKATQVVGSTCPNEPSPLAPFPVVSTHTAGLEPDTDTDASLVIPLPFNSQR